MAEDRIRRVKCLVKRRLCVDLEAEGLDGSNPKKIEPGEIVLLSPLQFEHYTRHQCVTRDLPLEEKE